MSAVSRGVKHAGFIEDDFGEMFDNTCIYISVVMTMRWAAKCLHKNMQCMKSIKEDDDGSQPGSKVNGDHRIPRRAKISSAAAGSASRAR